MTSAFEVEKPFPGARFGGTARLAGGTSDALAVIEAAEAASEFLPQALAECDGLMLLTGMDAIAEDPTLLAVHQGVPEILLVSSTPPTSRKPPPLPDPPLTADGKLPTQYPHRKGWHTDQSYRRPPPDISLFFAVVPVPQGQGQTLFANGTAAYEALPAALRRQVERLEGLHVRLFTGRSRDAVLRGETPRPLAPHERSQAQPVVRIHPVTGRPSIYLCESSQMDWVDGPFIGMEPGPHGDGAKLLDELMTHLTRPEFIYAHEWSPGDLLVWDNRCLVHSATWFDAATYKRVMWRTTVHGNPGAIYAGERKSWIQREEVAAE
jgi:taurine dioxygenase